MYSFFFAVVRLRDRLVEAVIKRMGEEVFVYRPRKKVRAASGLIKVLAIAEKSNKRKGGDNIGPEKVEKKLQIIILAKKRQ